MLSTKLVEKCYYAIINTVTAGNQAAKTRQILVALFYHLYHTNTEFCISCSAIPRSEKFMQNAISSNIMTACMIHWCQIYNWLLWIANEELCIYNFIILEIRGFVTWYWKISLGGGGLLFIFIFDPIIFSFFQ